VVHCSWCAIRAHAEQEALMTVALAESDLLVEVEAIAVLP
jgi:hypothetical protein